MLRIEDKLDQTRTTLQTCANKWIRRWGQACGIEPGREPQRAARQAAAVRQCAVRLCRRLSLADYDDIARKLILAHHTALIDRSTLERWLNEGAHALRSLFSLAQQYRYFGLHPRRFRGKKECRSGVALEKFGELPQDVWKARAPLDVCAAHGAPWSATGG